MEVRSVVLSVSTRTEQEKTSQSLVVVGGEKRKEEGRKRRGKGEVEKGGKY